LAFFDFGASASALPNGRVATSSEQTSSVQKMRFMEPHFFGWRMWESGSCLRAAEPFVETDAAEARFAQRHE
jgi:hypothetical protein